MKKQAVCEYCGKIFEEKLNSNEPRGYKQKCADHEITHLNLTEKFIKNLTIALNSLDNKNQKKSKIIRADVSVCFDSCSGEYITYSFEVKNSAMVQNIIDEITVSYDKKEEIPTVEEIEAIIDGQIIIPSINSKHEGMFNFDDWSGTNDYMIGDSYMKNIYESFKGKKVRIEIID